MGLDGREKKKRKKNFNKQNNLKNDGCTVEELWVGVGRTQGSGRPVHQWLSSHSGTSGAGGKRWEMPYGARWDRKKEKKGNKLQHSGGQ